MLAFGPAALADELLDPIEVRSENGVCDVVLDAVIRTQSFPAAGATYSLRAPVYVLRKANGKDVVEKPGDSHLVGPTLRVKRGELLKIRINNCFDPSLLPADPQDAPEDYPQEFYATNLHTHGLHISPAGTADNIFVTILPGEHHQYEYRIPDDHPAGTFWYHPHRHGSVALQLTSGMAGALIVEGDQGVLAKGSTKLTEKVFVLEQIHGVLTGSLLSANPPDIYDKIKSATSANSGAQVSLGSLRVLSGQRNQRRAAALKSQPAKAPDAANPCADDPPIDPSQTTEWLLVNGQAPQCRTIAMHLGEVQRWRFLHAGIDEVINIAVRQTDKDGAITYIPFLEFAVDGIPRGRGVKDYQRYLYPAYRVDVLFQAPACPPAGSKLELWSEAAPAPVTLNGTATPPRRIATIKLENTSVNMSFPDDEGLAEAVPVALRGSISNVDVEGRRWHLRFNFPADQPSRFPINGHEYSMDRIDRHVRLGTAEEWIIQSDSGTNNNAGHPFHIHVNPFLHYQHGIARAVQGLAPLVNISKRTLLTQLGFSTGATLTFTVKLTTGETFPVNMAVTATATLGDLANDLLGALNTKQADGFRFAYVENGMLLTPFLSTANLDDVNISQIAPAYPQLSFAASARQVIDLVWRDTLLAPSKGNEVIRMRFRDFTGDTVLHCHIVDHEDQGMMKNIRIEPAEVPGPMVGEEAGRSDSMGASYSDFSLPDAFGKVHRLADLARHPSILLFFRGRACVHCNAQLQSFALLCARFAALGVNVIAISSTGVQALPKATTGGDPFPILFLADARREAFRVFGCLDASDSPLHGTFVVERGGKVRFSNVGKEPFMDAERVLAEVERPAS